MPETFDDHHPFHYKKYWEAYDPAKAIRQAVIARGMARSVHNLLHRENPAVPPLSYTSLTLIAPKMATHYDNVFEGIDDFSLAVDRANEHPKMRPGERDLNLLAVDSLRAQIPLLREGLRSSRVRLIS